MEERTTRRRKSTAKRSPVARKRAVVASKAHPRAHARTTVTPLTRWARFATVASEMLLVGAIGYTVVTVGALCAYMGFLVGAQESLAHDAIVALQHAPTAAIATQDTTDSFK